MMPPVELAAAYMDYLNRWRQGSDDLPAVNLVFEWERRIIEEPEAAWPIFDEIVSGLTADDEMLEMVWYRLELLLAHHWNAFHTRVADLVNSTPRLRQVMAPNGLDAARYEQHVPGIDEFIPPYLSHVAALDGFIEFGRRIKEDSEAGLQLALTLIERGPTGGLDTTDIRGPLQDILRHHGPAVIDRVEAAASVSGRVRRALWRMQRHELGLPMHLRVPDAIWQRARQAATTTTDYTDDADVSSLTVPALAPELEELLAAWMTYRQNSWADEELNRLIQERPELAWEAIVRIVAQADDLGFIGAGPLEDLLRLHCASLIERVERQAVMDARFRVCLSKVWRVGLPDDLWQRVIAASDRADD